MTLGEFLTALKAVPADHHIYFDFGHLYPDGFTSWRGSYDCLALEWATADERNRRNGDCKPSVKVSELIESAEDEIGASHEGWKGGTFCMGKNTLVWVDRAGESSCTAVTAVTDNGTWATIRTAYEPTPW